MATTALGPKNSTWPPSSNVCKLGSGCGVGVAGGAVGSTVGPAVASTTAVASMSFSSGATSVGVSSTTATSASTVGPGVAVTTHGVWVGWTAVSCGVLQAANTSKALPIINGNIFFIELILFTHCLYKPKMFSTKMVQNGFLQNGQRCCWFCI